MPKPRIMRMVVDAQETVGSLVTADVKLVAPAIVVEAVVVPVAN